MAKKKISELVKELTGDFLLENGLELYHCEFVKEGRDWFLRVYIDKHDPDSYVSTDDCEMVSRFLSDRLDEEDPIAQNYYLEVSSPGMDRILYEPEHFEKFKGKQVEVKLYKAINGRKVFTGTLQPLPKQPRCLLLCTTYRAAPAATLHRQPWHALRRILKTLSPLKKQQAM